METLSTMGSKSCSSLWINNFVDGLSGIAIRAKRAIFSDASPFQKIEIFDTYGFGRVLCLADILVLTERDEFIYHESIVHPAMMMHASPSRVCIIGGGDGGCLREVLLHKEVKIVTVVEIDKLVKDTAVKHLPSIAAGFSDPRTKTVFDDGCSFLDTTSDLFDVVIVDSFDPGGPVQSLETVGFFRLVSEHLDKGGIAVFQTDSPTLKADALRKTLTGISSFFKVYEPYICSLPSFPEGICSFCVCSHDAGSMKAFNADRFAKIASECKYYNADVHRGAFFLPEYIKRCIGR
jgi:spermidine synthase